MGKVKYMETKTNRQECQSKEQSTLNAFRESPENESRVSTSSDAVYAIVAKELKNKVSFSKLLERDGKELIATAHAYKCMCPFHKDDRNQFYVWPTDNGGTCYGCEWRGDIYAYLMEKHEVDFREAVEELSRLSTHILRGEEGA